MAYIFETLSRCIIRNKSCQKHIILFNIQLMITMYTLYSSFMTHFSRLMILDIHSIRETRKLWPYDRDVVNLTFGLILCLLNIVNHIFYCTYTCQSWVYGSVLFPFSVKNHKSPVPAVKYKYLACFGNVLAAFVFPTGFSSTTLLGTRYT